MTWDEGLKRAYTHPEVYALDVQAALFGYNAPDWRTLPDAVRIRYPGYDLSSPQWPSFEIGFHHPPFIDLAAEYPTLAASSLALLVKPGRQRLPRPERRAVRPRGLRDQRQDHRVTLDPQKASTNSVCARPLCTPARAC